VHFSRRKSATKFLCVKTVSGKVARHSVAYLSVQKWFMGDVPVFVSNLAETDPPPPSKMLISNQYSLEAPQSAAKPGEKSSINMKKN